MGVNRGSHIPGFVQHLSLDVDLGSLADEQGSHVGVALLGGQMERCDALLGQDVGLGVVLQQHCGDFHLVLLRRNVERSVAILVDAGEGETLVLMLNVTD